MAAFRLQTALMKTLPNAIVKNAGTVWDGMLRCGSLQSFFWIRIASKRGVASSGDAQDAGGFKISPG